MMTVVEERGKACVRRSPRDKWTQFFWVFGKGRVHRVVHAHAPQYPKLPTCIYKERHGFAEDQEPQQLKCDIGNALLANESLTTR